MAHFNTNQLVRYSCISIYMVLIKHGYDKFYINIGILWEGRM